MNDGTVFLLVMFGFGLLGGLPTEGVCDALHRPPFIFHLSLAGSVSSIPDDFFFDCFFQSF